MITFKDISIIIPVGPEENELEALWDDLRPIKKEAELIVIRGASRPHQLNEGVRNATRDFLWFLHADSRFAKSTLTALIRALNSDPDVFYYFDLRFLNDGPPLMRINEIGCWVRSRLMGLPFGDQGFCLSTMNFKRVGGFPEEAPYGEDHLFVWRARQKKVRLRSTGAALYTSARRYAKTGWAKLTWAYARQWTRQAWPEWKKPYEKTSDIRQVPRGR
ncbi:MAG: glycosyltransferase [Deltaproteobacteria bacterium]|nr:glycosyltransferase [Deltaproteobacteria bacterium]